MLTASVVVVLAFLACVARARPDDAAHLFDELHSATGFSPELHSAAGFPKVPDIDRNIPHAPHLADLVDEEDFEMPTVKHRLQRKPAHAVARALAESSCTDTDAGAVGSFGIGCAGYGNAADACGNGDDDDFTMSMMCCICGGGATSVPMNMPPPSPPVPSPPSLSRCNRSMQ